MEDKMLIQAYELVRRSDVFFDRAPLEWTRQFYSMHKRGWLYGATEGERLLAIAGAFRIPEWDERYRYEIPEFECGNLLYVSFFCSQSDDITVALKLLKHFLKENSDVNEMIYYKKDWNAGQKMFKLFKQENHSSEPDAEETITEQPMGRKRLMIQPPEVTSNLSLNWPSNFGSGAWLVNELN